MIYRDFNHWWTEGKHGHSSASREYVRELWDDLAPTIEASRDDYKNAFNELAKERASQRSEILDAALAYIEKYAKDDAPKFFGWYVVDYSKKDNK